MADSTKSEAERSLFISVRDTNTGKVSRLAIPSDVQVGLKGNPAELQLLGRLSLSTASYNATRSNKGVISITSNDTVVSVNTVDAPSSGRITLKLPKNPRDGQVHFIKDASGTSVTSPIDVVPSNGSLIDDETFKSISTSYGTIAVYWESNSWHVLVAASGDDSSGGAPANATYITLTNNGTLSRERRLNLTGSNIVMDDQGPNASVVLDLSPILGGGAGSYTYASLTVDQYGRITAVGSGAPPTPSNASYITVANEASLSDERRFFPSTGIKTTDGGAGSTFSVRIDDNVVATISGSTFTGPVIAQGGLSGSIQMLPSGLSYLVQGANVTITSQSNGQIIISAAASGGSGGADVSGSYVTIGNTGSLPNERALAISSGLTMADGGAGSTVTLGINNNVLATISGSTFTGPVIANNGLTGSIQKIAGNLSYLVGAGGVSIISQSNGQIIISGSGTSGGGSSGGSTTTAAYDGYFTGSVNWGNPTAWTDFTTIIDPGRIFENVKVGINRSGSTYTVDQTGYYAWASFFNSYVTSNGYLAFRLSGSNGTLIQQTHYDEAASGNGNKLNGVFYLTSGSSFKLQFVTKAGTRTPFVSNDPIGTAPDTENMVTGRMSMFLVGVGSTVVTSSMKAYPRYHDTTFNPVGLWQLSGTLADSSGNGYDLSVNTGTTLYAPISPGMLGFAFNGSTLLQSAVAPANLILTGAMTLEMLVTPWRLGSSDQYVVAIGGAGESYQTNYLYSFFLSANNNAISYLCESGSAGANVSFSTSGSLLVGASPVHLAMVRDSTNQVKFYLNGEQVSSGSSGLANASFAPTYTGRFYLGAADNAALFFIGTLASVKVIASGLTPAQVWREFEYTLGPLYGVAAGADVAASYITMFNTGSLPNERALAVSQGITLTDGGPGSNVTLGINNSIIATVSGTTFTGVVSASAGLTGSLQRVGPGLPYLIAQGNVAITTQSNGQIIISGSGASGGGGTTIITGNPVGFARYHDSTYNPVALWQFSGSMNDSGPYGFNLSLNAGTNSYVELYPGLLGHYCDGTNWLVSTTNPTQLMLTGAMTLEAIVIPSRFTAATQVLCELGANAESYSTNTLWSLRQDANTGAISYHGESGSAGNNIFYPVSSSWVVGNPVHIAMVRGSDNQITFYVNGSKAGNTSVGLTNVSFAGAYTGRVSFGADNAGGANFQGAIASAKLIDSALTPAQVRREFEYTLGQLYGVTNIITPVTASFKGLPRYHDTTYSPVALYQLSGTLVDQINANNLSVAAGTEGYANIAPGLMGFWFNGATQLQGAVAAPFMVITGSLTVECIISPARQNSTQQRFIQEAGTAASDTYATNCLWSLDLTANQNALQFTSESGSAGTNIIYTTSASLGVGLPYHLAMVRGSDDQVTFYVNGIAATSTSSGLSNASTVASVARVELGGPTGVSQFFMGTIASVKIMSSALTPAQVWREFDYTLGPMYGITTSSLPWFDGGEKLKTSSSISVSTDNTFASSNGIDTYFFVSGTVDVAEKGGSALAARLSAIGGDLIVSGNVKSHVKWAPPLSATWLAVNVHPTSSMFIDQPHSLFMSGNALTGNKQHLIVRTAPATPYSITSRLRVMAAPTATSLAQFGMVWRESSTGRIVNSSIYYSTTASPAGPRFTTAKWTGPETFSANYTDSAFFAMGGTDLWLKISDDGTYRRCYYGCDGLNFYEIHNVSRTDFLTADQVGFSVRGQSAQAMMQILTWKVESP